MRLSICLLLSLANGFANNFLRGKIKSVTAGRYEDGSGQLRELPIDFNWTTEQVAFIKYKYNIAIQSQYGSSARGYYAFTQQSPFPVNRWPTSYSKRTTIIPILISAEFPVNFIKQLERTINSLTAQSACVEFLPIMSSEVSRYQNYINIKPGQHCAGGIGLPDEQVKELTIELGQACRESPVIVRSMLLHAAGLAPNSISGRSISTDEVSAYKLCSRIGLYSLCDKDPACSIAQPRGYTIARQAGSRDEAVMICQREYGMELAIVSTPEEARILQFLLTNDDENLDRAKYWLGNKPNYGLIGGKWAGVWASGFPVKGAVNAPVYMSYSASGWEWRNDLSPSSKLPAICESRKNASDTPYSVCMNNMCSTNARCIPSASAYQCKCEKGYYGSGFTCIPSKCPTGTIQLKESCVRDQCVHCKPRFACRNENAGTPSAKCKCKEGWSGNGKLCLPQKSLKTSDMASFSNDEPSPRPVMKQHLSQMIEGDEDEVPLKKSNAGIAALNALTSKLNQLSASNKLRTYNSQSTQSLWRTDPPLKERMTSTSFASKVVEDIEPVYNSIYHTPAELLTESIPARTTTQATAAPTPRTIYITHPPIDVDGIKDDVSSLQNSAALAQVTAEKIQVEQDKLQGDVDRVLALVQAFMAQSKEDRKSVDGELDRLKDYSDYFSSRIDEISTNVNEVHNLKKSAAQEQKQYNQLNAIAQDLREEIFNLEDQVKTTVDETEEKVNHVEGQVVANRVKVDKAQYQNQNNKLRIEQAEKQIGELEQFESTVEQTVDRLMENEGHLGELNNWVTNLDTALENQHYDLEDKAETIGDNQIQITLLESNVTKLDQRFVKSGVQLNNFKHNINHKTEHILKKEQNLEKVVSQVRKESANFTAMIDTVSSDVISHHAAFEKGLKTASTSAAYAKQKAEHAQNQLATYVKRTNRANQTLFGKINRQNDLLAYLMNKVQKLEQTLQDRTNAPMPTQPPSPVKTEAASSPSTTLTN